MKNIKCIFMALSVMVVMIFSVFGCDSEQSNETDENTTSSSKNEAADEVDTNDKFIVGYNTWTEGAYPLDILVWAATQSYEAIGMELVVLNDEANADKSISNVQNLISQGVDVVNYFAPTENQALTVAQLCLNAKIPFLLRDSLPVTQSIVNEIKENPYFIGFVGTSNEQAGDVMAQKVIEGGLQKGIVIGVDRGQASQDGRINAFIETSEENGVAILGEARPSAASMEDITAKTEDIITANQDSDFIYAAFADCATASLSIIDSYDISPKIYVADINPSILEYLADGSFQIAQGGHWVEETWEAAMVYNYLTGHPMVNENEEPLMIDSLKMITLTAECIELYQKCWLDEYAHSTDYIKSFCYEFNPDMSNEYFINEINDYSFEQRVRMKYEEGKITNEELEAAGVSIN